MTPEQRRLLNAYAYKRPHWLGMLGSAISVGLNAIDFRAPVPVEVIECLQGRGDRLAGFPELEAAVAALLCAIAEVPRG